jgi:Alpha/beta hydrolase family
MIQPILETVAVAPAVETARPIICVHSFWANARCWAPMQQQLAEHGHRSTAISLRGHGTSEGRLRGSSIGDYAADVSHVIDAHVGASPIVIAHSAGANVGGSDQSSAPANDSITSVSATNCHLENSKPSAATSTTNRYAPFLTFSHSGVLDRRNNPTAQPSLLVRAKIVSSVNETCSEQSQKTPEQHSKQSKEHHMLSLPTETQSHARISSLHGLSKTALRAD